MSFYTILIFLHTIAAMLLLPLITLPKLFNMHESKEGRLLLHRLHAVIGVGGWMLIITGSIMLYLQNGAMLYFLWMQFSLALFVTIQVIDHFWADRQEECLESGKLIDYSKLKLWMVAKIFGYGLIALLMVTQPS